MKAAAIATTWSPIDARVQNGSRRPSVIAKTPPNVAGQRRRVEGVQVGTEWSSLRPTHRLVSENGHGLKLVPAGIKVKLEFAPGAFDLPLGDLSELHARMLPHYLPYLLRV